MQTNQVPPVRNPTPILAEIAGDGPLVVTLKGRVHQDQKLEVKRLFEREFPGRAIVVVDEGVSVSPLADPSVLVRIEAKLDVLLAALAEDDEEEGPQYDLDGNPLLSQERDLHESLD